MAKYILEMIKNVKKPLNQDLNMQNVFTRNINYKVMKKRRNCQEKKNNLKIDLYIYHLIVIYILQI